MKVSNLHPIQDIRHLGVLLGDPAANRIIAVSTSNVFHDHSLLKTFWQINDTSIDSGFQGHMYTRLNDILAVQVPYCNSRVPEMITASIEINYNIWKSLTGIELSSPACGGIILATPATVQPENKLPQNITWYKGGILDAAVARHYDGGEALLASVFNKPFAEKLQQQEPGYAFLDQRARATSFLMDKNNVMQILQENNSSCARTYIFNEDTASLLNKIPGSSHYIFKPAGGAAGIGVFGNNNGGANLDEIREHLSYLKKSNKLPSRFQVQEFLSGTLQGYTAYLNEDGSFEIFEIHQQFINEAGRFTGGRWTNENQAKHLQNATALYHQLAAIERPHFYGLICLDVIDGKIIEINPRVTASAPITHILRVQDELKKQAGNDFTIQQIDINTSMQIPYDFFSSGKLEQLIKQTWEQNRMMVLPQGLNPFGNSRLVFVNDNKKGTGQQMFIKKING